MKKIIPQDEIDYMTWLLNVNVDNIQSNQEAIKEEGERLLVCDDYDLKMFLKTLSVHDEIEFDKIDYKKVRENIAEFI